MSSATPHETAAGGEKHQGQTKVERGVEQVKERACASQSRIEVLFAECHSSPTLQLCRLFISRHANWQDKCDYRVHISFSLTHTHSPTHSLSSPHCASYIRSHAFASSSGGDAKRIVSGLNMVITMRNPRVKPLYKVSKLLSRSRRA